MRDKISTGAVQSVERALELLEIISGEKEIGIRELSRQSGLSRSTVQRLIFTLLKVGYLTQNPLNQKYHLSFKLFQLGNRAIFQNDLRTIARPILEQMLFQVQETIVLGILDMGDVIYVDKITVPQEIQLASTVGSRVPSHCTATGKAILAFLPKDERLTILRGKQLKAYTNHTITGLPELEKELAAIRSRGYSIDNEERYPSVISVAAPIFDYTEKVAGAVGVPGFTYRIPPERVPVLGETVIGIAREISSRLGFTKWLELNQDPGGELNVGSRK